MTAKDLAKRTFRALGLKIYRLPRTGGPGGGRLPDAEMYELVFQPWLAPGEFREIYALAKPRTLVTADRCHVLYTLARQALALDGEFWECGVYRGGTALLLGEVVARSRTRCAPRTLRLFDTFAGMPDGDPARDLHRRGDFADTNLETLRALFRGYSRVEFHPGLVPETFAALQDSKVAFAHVDVDLYRSVLDCCEFLYPRLVSGGFLVFDDYGFPSCPGARQAVDEFFEKLPECPLVLPTGQAVVFRGPPLQPEGATFVRPTGGEKIPS